MDAENVVKMHSGVLAIKNEIMLFAGKWMVLEIIMLSEISQTEKNNVTCSLSHVECRP
jgi:hypothetical protein